MGTGPAFPSAVAPPLGQRRSPTPKRGKMAEMQEGRSAGTEVHTSAGIVGIAKEERAAQGLPPVYLLVVDDDQQVRGVFREQAGWNF